LLGICHLIVAITGPELIENGDFRAVHRQDHTIADRAALVPAEELDFRLQCRSDCDHAGPVVIEAMLCQAAAPAS
jgi:hypothetical protein